MEIKVTQRTLATAPKAEVPRRGPNAPLPPPGLSPRCFEILKVVSFVGPAPFPAIERLAGVLCPRLAELKAARRLVYRELERLQARGYVGWRRLPLEAVGVFYLARRGRALARTLGVAEVPEDVLKRFTAFPEHEALLRGFRLEVLLARFRGVGCVHGLSWNDRARFPVSADGRDGCYEPDGLYRFKLEDEVLEILVELDRGTETLGRWCDKICKAKAVLSEGKGTSRLLILAQSPKRLRSLVREAARVLGEKAETLRGIETSAVSADTILTRAVCLTTKGSLAPLLR